MTPAVMFACVACLFLSSWGWARLADDDPDAKFPATVAAAQALFGLTLIVVAALMAGGAQ